MRWLFAALLAVSVLVSRALALDWPEGVVVHEGSTSADGQYGIAVPESEKSYDADAANYLANLKTHQLVGKIKTGDYFEHQNHAHLDVTWSDDSRNCVLTYEGRFGFGAVGVLQVKGGGGFTENDLGKHIEKSLQAAVGGDGTASAWFRFRSGNKLAARALIYTGNPKMIEADSKEARFVGTFDLASHKWITSKTQKTNEWDALSSAYGPGGEIVVDPKGDGSTRPGERIVASEEEKATALDENMNAVYAGLRIVLPRDRFAKVRQEQVTWLKQRDAASSAEVKCQLLEARTKALDDLLWQD